MFVSAWIIVMSDVDEAATMNGYIFEIGSRKVAARGNSSYTSLIMQSSFFALSTKYIIVIQAITDYVILSSYLRR